MGSTLWQRLRHARRYADMTQLELSSKCGVSRGAVALWESSDDGHRTKPTVDHLLIISKETGVPIEWLLNDASNLDELWRITGEYGDKSPGARAGSQQADVLPDLRQGGHLFLFAKTEDQLAAKLKAVASEPPTTKCHLVLVGVDAAVHTAPTPADALARVVQVLTERQ